MANFKLIVLLLIISTTFVDGRALRKRRQLATGYYGQSQYPYSNSIYGSGISNPYLQTDPLQYFALGSQYGTNSYGTGIGQYGSTYGQYGSGYPSSSMYGYNSQIPYGSNYNSLYPNTGSSIYGQYGSNMYSGYPNTGLNNQYGYGGSGLGSQYGYGASGISGQYGYGTPGLGGQYGYGTSGLGGQYGYGTSQYGYGTQGNPWYRVGRKGAVQGRSGGPSDLNANDNAAAPNAIPPVAKPSS
ncbi:unnamed protein product [Rotaria socialis]|uniref:Uncharacterized protein n=1 Tax=Rotaria socialis TaxID=392032 RepID=A0A821F5M2_9BILA|nr:unnamed protein product [Rotaria socialis]